MRHATERVQFAHSQHIAHTALPYKSVTSTLRFRLLRLRKATKFEPRKTHFPGKRPFSCPPKSSSKIRRKSSIPLLRRQPVAPPVASPAVKSLPRENPSGMPKLGLQSPGPEGTQLVHHQLHDPVPRRRHRRALHVQLEGPHLRAGSLGSRHQCRHRHVLSPPAHASRLSRSQMAGIHTRGLRNHGARRRPDFLGLVASRASPTLRPRRRPAHAARRRMVGSRRLDSSSAIRSTPKPTRWRATSPTSPATASTAG